MLFCTKCYFYGRDFLPTVILFAKIILRACCRADFHPFHNLILRAGYILFFFFHQIIGASMFSRVSSFRVRNYCYTPGSYERVFFSLYSIIVTRMVSCVFLVLSPKYVYTQVSGQFFFFHQINSCRQYLRDVFSFRQIIHVIRSLVLIFPLS